MKIFSYIYIGPILSKSTWNMLWCTELCLIITVASTTLALAMANKPAPPIFCQHRALTGFLFDDKLPKSSTSSILPEYIWCGFVSLCRCANWCWQVWRLQQVMHRPVADELVSLIHLQEYYSIWKLGYFLIEYNKIESELLQVTLSMLL